MLLVIQSGHYGRTSGATGGPGERELMIRYARAAKDLVDQVPGWEAVIIPADADVEGDDDPYQRYRGDAFIALHADATGSSSARGGSVGYRNTPGRELAHAWKDAWRAEVGDNIAPYRADNYTTNLSGYYGTRRAVAVGNTRCCIVEHGFMTNSTEREYLELESTVQKAARAVCKAVTGTIPNQQEYDVISTTDIERIAAAVVGAQLVNPRRDGVATESVGEFVTGTFRDAGLTLAALARVEAKLDALLEAVQALDTTEPVDVGALAAAVWGHELVNPRFADGRKHPAGAFQTGTYRDVGHIAETVDAPLGPDAS